ncbi:MAG: hypothetical protein IKH51_09715 [Clostridia bacterium]|nr:hypothetical protein [Clostridia bacterium]
MKRIIPFVLILIFAFSLNSTAAKNITDEEIKERFLHAAWAYAWWYGDSDMDVENELNGLTRIEYPSDVENFIEVQTDGIYTYKFYIVPFEEINTKEKMKNYLLSYFSPETVDEIMKKDMPFKEGENGYLYKMPGYVRQLSGPQVYEPSDYEIISKTDKKIVLRVYPDKKNYPDKYYDYKFEKNDNGDFVLTNYICYRYILNMENPQTSDAPVIAVCALAISAVAAAVILKKKRY